ncbi:MAG: ABC transporter permease [Candidatus Nezhaarchaeota archaeon]|nr:ABC transporter permease [Candidatus Nezhaarchaeota archaeon]
MCGEILDVVARSLLISSSATLLAAAWSIPASVKLASSRSRWRDPVVGVFNALVGFPAVLVGLLVYLAFSRSGPLGWLNLLYTPQAIIIGQAALITPLFISLSYELFARAIDNYWELAVSLGASKLQAYGLVVKEVLGEVLVVVLVAFARAIGELGVALLVGGNIKGTTRVLTTAIALEVEKGEFDKALTLGLLLLLAIVVVAMSSRLIKRRLS